MRKILRYWLLAGLVLSPICVNAQDHGIPGLQAVGRFLGHGYSRSGHQSVSGGHATGFQTRQPASAYPSAGLQYPYAPGYQPQRPQPQSQFPTYSQHSQPQFIQPPSVAPELPTETPVEPAEPAPKWLEPYLGDKLPAEEVSPVPLQDESTGELTPPQVPSELLEPAAPNEASEPNALLEPSEPKREGPFYLDPAPSPSDRLPAADSDSDDLLLEEDDDDLLLLDDTDDLSARRLHPGTPARHIPRLSSPQFAQPLPPRYAAPQGQQPAASAQFTGPPQYLAGQHLPPPRPYPQAQPYAAPQQHASSQQYQPAQQFAAPQQYQPAQQFAAPQQYRPTQPYAAPQQYPPAQQYPPNRTKTAQQRFYGSPYYK